MVKLYLSDYLVILSVLMLLGAHGLTNFFVSYHKDVAKDLKIQEKAALMYEANPVMRTFLELGNFQVIFSYVIIPSVFTMFYYFHRKKLVADGNIHALNSMAVMIFMAFMIDFMNDLSIVMGLVLR